MREDVSLLVFHYFLALEKVPNENWSEFYEKAYFNNDAYLFDSHYQSPSTYAHTNNSEGTLLLM